MSRQWKFLALAYMGSFDEEIYLTYTTELQRRNHHNLVIRYERKRETMSVTLIYDGKEKKHVT
jgi:hypothetical protein